MGYSDTDVAEYIYTSKPDIEALANYLCKGLTKSCKTKPPPVPKVIGLLFYIFVSIIMCSFLTDIEKAIILFKLDTCYISLGITQLWFKCGCVSQSILQLSVLHDSPSN